MLKQRLIPGYVGQTLILAKAAGLKAWVAEQDDDNEGDSESIVCKIRGTRDRLRAAKFVTKKFKFPLRGAKSDPHPYSGWVERVEHDEFMLTTRWTAPIELARDPRYAVERLTFPAVAMARRFTKDRMIDRSGKPCPLIFGDKSSYTTAQVRFDDLRDLPERVSIWLNAKQLLNAERAIVSERGCNLRSCSLSQLLKLLFSLPFLTPQSVLG